MRSRPRSARTERARPRPRERRCRLVVMGSAERPRGDHLFMRDPLPNNSFAPAVICRRASGTADRAGAALGRPLKHVAPVQRARILTLAAKLLKFERGAVFFWFTSRNIVSNSAVRPPLVAIAAIWDLRPFSSVARRRNQRICSDFGNFCQILIFLVKF